MKTLKIKHISIATIIGLGYYKDVYKKEKTGFDGVAHNIILPFIRIQLAYLKYN